MIRQSADGIRVYRFEEINSSSLCHAVLGRVGGISRAPFATLNLGHTVGDDPAAVEENHRRGLGALGLGLGQTVSPYQVHGSHVALVGLGHLGTVQPASDALVTMQRGVHLLLRFADCVPVLFFDPTRGAIGLAHAGWRGVVKNVAGETVRVMCKRFRCSPAHIWAGIGPAVGPCCYEVDSQVEGAVAAACPPGAIVSQRNDGAIMLDLPAAVRAQLEAVGVCHIEDSGVCTACHVDEFFSHRVENARTGRFGVVIGLTP